MLESNDLNRLNLILKKTWSKLQHLHSVNFMNHVQTWFPGSRLRHRVRGSPIPARPSCALPQLGSRERHHQDVPMASPAWGPKWPLRSTRRSHHLIWRVFFKPNAKLINVQYRGVGRHSSIGDPQEPYPRKLYHGSPFFSTPNVFMKHWLLVNPTVSPGPLSSDVPASETPTICTSRLLLHTYIHMYPFTHLFVLVWPCAQYESSLVMQMCHFKFFFFSKPMPATPLCPPHPSYFSRSSQASPIVIGTFCSLVTAHDENKDLVRGTWYIFYNGAKVFMRPMFDSYSAMLRNTSYFLLI